MKFIIIISLLILSLNSFSQKNAVPIHTKLDTLKANVAYDSLQTVQVMNDFRNSVFKELNTSDEYEYMKALIDKFMLLKKQRWEAYIKQNNK